MSKRQETIVFNLQANVEQIKQSANEINSVFSKLNLPQSVQASFSKTFNKLTEDIRTFEAQAGKGFKNLADTKKAEKNIETIVTDFEKLRVQVKDVKGFSADKLLPKEVLDRVKQYKELLDKANKLTLKDNSSGINRAAEAVKKAQQKFDDNEQSIKKNNAAIQDNENRYKELSQYISNAEKSLKALVTRREELKNKKNRTADEASEYAILDTRINAVKSSLTSYNKELISNEANGKKLEETQSQLSVSAVTLQENLNKANQELTNIKNSSAVTDSELQNLRQRLANIANVDPGTLPDTLQGLITRIQELSADASNLDAIKIALGELESKLHSGADGAQQFGQTFHNTISQSVEDMTRANSEMDQLKTRLTYFFSAMNGVQLFKRAIRSAYESVKELDAAITEMAVVTDYSINDIWGNIPEYTRTATELGATTKDVINSMVLYTQQGLKMSQATELSTQTMKMARIAGLGGAEATDLMTAALRGFNMELNEASAQRVNDVYSNLAANAAANTHEIADAMTRTASIANAAGMEFETTAAFLTQMIETTRESAENLGTAMKTIVARFTEMKKAPGEIIEVDGEEVNVNKVEAALKSVGVQLRDTQGQFRDLDDVFLELASKWDSLDVMSQRYVATMAAGSRQQSRFIAMMSNYQRTMELMGYATNSAGASQKQFEKTMDSLTSKLNRLHNVWEQFVTGIANQSIIKGVVDLLTNLLTTVNKVTDALDPFHTGWSKILAAFLGFKAAKGVVNGVLKGIGTQLGTRKPNQTTVPGGGPTKTGLDEKQGTVDGTKYGKGFWGAFQKMQAQKKDPMDARPITNNIKQSKQLTKEAAELKKNSVALKNQGAELTKLEKQYKDYSNTIATANTQGKNSQKIASKSRTAILQQNQALQRQEASLRENLAVESEAYGQSVARTAKLQEQEAALTGKSAALTKDTAEQFANTSSEELNTAAATANQGATEMETAAKEKEVLATEMNTAITTKDTIAQEANNMTRGQALLGLFSLNKAKRLAAAVSLGLMSAEEAEAIAKKGATAAQNSFNAALYSCPIMWIIAAIAALIAGLALLVGWLNKIEEDKRETEKARLEGITQATEDATKKAEEAKEAYDNLLESKNTYNKLREELNSLVEGSEAYIKKLEEQKKLVQETIKNNPNLAAYVTYDVNGNPTISSKGWEIEEQRLKAVELNATLSDTYNDITSTWEQYLDNFKKNGADGFTVAGKNLTFYASSNSTEFVKGLYSADYDIPYRHDYDTIKGDKSNGLSTKYFQKLGTGFATGLITKENKENDQNYIKKGEYYIEKDFYESIKGLTPDLKKERTVRRYNTIYSLNSFNAAEKGKTPDYYISDESLISAIEQTDKNGSALLKQTQDSMRYVYETAALSILENTYGLSDVLKNRMAVSLANAEVASGEFATDVDSFSQDIKDMVEDNDRSELEQKYKAIYGVFNEEELGFDENDEHYEDKIKGYLAAAIVANKKFAGKVKTAVENYYKAYGEYGDDFVTALELSTGQVDQFMNEDLGLALLSSETFEGFSEQGSLKKQKLTEMLNTLGISSPQDLEKIWATTRANLVQALKKSYDLFGMTAPNNLSTNFSSFTTLPGGSLKNALKYSELGINWEKQIKDLSTSIGKKVPINFSGIFGSLSNSSLFKDAKAAEAIYERISKINFSNPVRSAHEIKELTEDSNKDFVEWGETLKDRAKDVLTLTNQASYLYNSLGEQKEDLFKDGFISKDEMNELKKTLPDIQTMLDDNSLSASTLATYFNNINSGMLSIIGTSSNFISALDKINKAENTISDSMDFTANFEASESQQTITDSFSEWRESMEQSLERGQYGDQNLQDYAKAILGLDNWNKYYDEFEGNLQKVEELAFEKISLWGDNFYNLWKDFSSKSDLVSLGREGEINFDLSKITSVEDIIKALMDTYNVSEDIAKAAVADAQTYSSNFSEALNKLSINDSITELLQGSAQVQSSDGLYEIFVNRSELQVLADEAGIDINELITKIKENIDDNHKITVEDLINEDGTMSDSLESSLTEQITNSIQGAIKGIDNKGGIETINIGSYLEQLTAAGMAEDKAKEAITRIINQQLMANQKNTKGKKYGFDIKDGKLSIAIGFDSKKSAQEALNVTEYSDSLDDAFTKAGVSAWDSPEVAAARARAMADAATQMTAAIAAGMYIGRNIDKGKGIDTTTFKTIMTQSTEFSKMMDGWATEQEQLAQDATKAGEVTLNTMYTLDDLTSAYTNSTSREGWPDKNNGGSDSDSDWTNDYDKYYNTLKKIEGLERKRTELEKQQSYLIKQRYLDEEKLKANKQEQIKLLKQQARINSDLVNTTAAYLRGDSNGDVWFDEATGTIQQNPNAANYNEEQKKNFDKQLSLMEKHYETWKEANGNLEDIYVAIDELTKKAEFSIEDLTNNIDKAITVLDNTLSNLERVITRSERWDSGISGENLKKLYEQEAQTYVDKYNQLTAKKAINEQKFNGQIYSGYGKYIDVNWDTKEVQKSALYYTITDPDIKEKVDKFYDETVSLAESVIDIDNQQEDIKDSVYDLKKNLLDKALEFQEKVYDAVVKLRENEIETLNTINNSIKDAASDLISSIQKNIQKIRQDRNNKKTEEELNKMQSRLDFLRMDTSSGNQKTILDLEKQLEDKEQSYTDSLIDQKISELQDQNTEAEKQRKKQIEILQAQLDLSKENGTIWKNVDNAIKTGFDSSGKIQRGSDLYNMLASLDEVTKKNSAQFERWFGDLNNLASAYNASLTADLNVDGKMSNQVSNANDIFGENSKYIQTLKNQLEDMNRDGNFNHLVWYDQENEKVRYKYNVTHFDNETEKLAYDRKVAEYKDLAQMLANARAFYKINKNASFISAFNRMYGYDTGGIADYTGLAWLDGTPSSPELVLNKRDTENFIQLKDILASIMNNTSTGTTTKGDYYFEINVDVDKITNDYDVDKMVDRIKQQIINSAGYRNVNTINMIR